MKFEYLFVVLTIVLVSQSAWAHKPFFSDGQYLSPETAWQIDDIEISIVMYHEVTCSSQALWLKFDNEPGDLIYHQIGIPHLERMQNYRPVVAVVAPGLPETDVPFELPAGMGAQILNSYCGMSQRNFSSPLPAHVLILNDYLLQLPEGGGGYVVAWHPEGMTGKFWVAVGTVEDFTSEDIARVTSLGRRLEDFHEQRHHSPRPEMYICENPLGAAGGCQTTAPWAIDCNLGFSQTASKNPK